jgi:tetratricopeptide (TPR) repeat protein
LFRNGWRGTSSAKHVNEMIASPETRTRPFRAFGDRLSARRWLVWLGSVVLFIGLSAAIYAPAIGGSLIWDDQYLVGENPFFRSPVFGLEVFRHYLFFDSFSTYYRPVQNWSYMLDYWIWHGDPAGYHWTNILLHAASALLLFGLLRRVLPQRVGDTRKWLLPLLIALVWLVHPIHNAAVAYISGRADSLASFFALSAWLLVLRAQEVRHPAATWTLGFAAAACMLLALCAKEIALLWLLLFVLQQWFVRSAASGLSRWIATGAAVMVLALYAKLHALPEARIAMESAPGAPLHGRGLLMLRALGDYASLILWPAKLQMERSLSNPDALLSLPQWQANSRGEWLSILGFLVICGFVQLCRWKAEGRALRWIGAGWFAIAFLPISNLFPLNAEVAEHWIYLASIGFLIFLSGCALGVPRRLRPWLVGSAVLAIAALSWRTHLRSRDWVNAETFCQRTIAAGGATPRMLSTLASIYGARGDLQPQEQLLRTMLQRFPEFTTARINLGLCLLKQGKKTEAEVLLALPPEVAEQSTRRFPRTWRASLAVARLRSEAGDPAEAMRLLREARASFPQIWELVKAETELVKSSTDPATAVSICERFAADHWWHLDAWLTLGQLRSAGENHDGAVTAFEHAARLDLRDPRAFASIAETEFSRGNLEPALNAQLRAMARDPDQPTRYFALSEILSRMNRTSEAAAAAHRGRQLQSSGTNQS